VLRYNRVWRAKRDLSVCFRRVRQRAAHRQCDVTVREDGLVWRDAVESVKPSRQRHPSHLLVNQVRQCARRGVFELGVAQASPLFSDHAPREVHLWQ
jgi:hypothetical protein